jgi:hypothetical protein
MSLTSDRNAAEMSAALAMLIPWLALGAGRVFHHLPVPPHLAMKANPRYLRFMRKSTRPVKKKRGPPKGYGARGSKSLHVKVPPDELAALDAWIKQQPDKPSRPEGLRRLAKIALAKSR